MRKESDGSSQTMCLRLDSFRRVHEYGRHIRKEHYQASALRRNSINYHIPRYHDVNPFKDSVVVALLLIPEVRGEAGTDTGRVVIFSLLLRH